MIRVRAAPRWPSLCGAVVHALLETIVATVQKFSYGEQADDITLVVARCPHQMFGAPS